MNLRNEFDRSARSRNHAHRVSIGVLLLLIVYGSLYPLSWNFERPQDFIFLGRIGLSDVLENVVLFIPLGWLLASHYHDRARQWPKFTVWFLVALVLASALQWLQKYLPRTPQLSDIVFNMVGHVAGWWIGALSAHAQQRLVQRHQNLSSFDRFALLMVAIWLIAELFPLIPTLDVSTVIDNVKSLWQQEFWQPRRMLLHIGMTVIGLEALAHLVRSASSGRSVRLLAGIVTAGVLLGKFVVIGQSPGFAVVLGISGGALLWWIIDHLDESLRLTALMLIATGSYLLHALWPLQWREPPEPILWLPFASALSGTITSVVTTVAFEALCFGAIIWSAVRVGGVLSGMTMVTALLAFAAEWVQGYLPTRTPEITSVLTALGVGWLIASLGKTQTQRKER